MKISKQGYLLPLLISINNSLHLKLHHILQSRHPQAHSPSSPGAMSCRIHQAGDADNPPIAKGGERRRRNPTRNPKMIPWQSGVAWPHRQVPLPKSHYYFLGMEKKVKKSSGSHGFVLPPSKRKRLMQQQCCSGRSPFPTAPSSPPCPKLGGLQASPPGSGLGFVPDACRKLSEALEKETIPPPPLPPCLEIGDLITPFPSPTTTDSGQEVGALPPCAGSCPAAAQSHCARL